MLLDPHHPQPWKMPLLLLLPGLIYAQDVSVNNLFLMGKILSEKMDLVQC